VAAGRGILLSVPAVLDLPDSPFTRAEALARGLSRQVLADLAAARSVRRVLRNVYVRADVPDTVQTRALAAAKVVTPGTVFVDRTAAWLHGVDVLSYRELEILPPLECVVLRDRSRIERPECVGGERDLAPYDLMKVYGLRVTTPLRTALDLGCLLPRPDGLAALDLFARHHGVTRGQLEASLPRYRRRRGVVRLRELVAVVDARAESPRESRTRWAILDEGLPAPEPQFWVQHHGVPLFRLDLAYPRHRVAVEYDGADWHDRTDEQREADQARRDWLGRHGWTVIVVRSGDFSVDRRARWLGELREAIGLA
jgi:very-short-patch-repair endonuclease